MVAPLAEQEHIAAVVREQLTAVERMRAGLEAQVEEVSALPGVLLRQALSGKLVSAAAPSSRKPSQGIYFKRGAIAAYCVNRLHGQKTFGHVQQQKVLYLTEAHVGIDLEGIYERQAAGPLADYFYKLENLAKRKNWFTVHRRGAEGYFYRIGRNIADRLGPAEAILGERKAEMDRLLDLVAGMDTEQAEVVTTLFAAWNDMLIEGRSPSDHEIITDVRGNWHTSKKRFAQTRLQEALNWMRRHDLVPLGVGPKTAANTKTKPGSPGPRSQRRTKHGVRE